jgi:hypothetical protein
MAMSKPDQAQQSTGNRTTKYSITWSTRWHWEHDEGNPRLTDHALTRWDERMPPSAVAPETAWEQSVGVDYINQHFDDTEEVRLYAERDAKDNRYAAVFIIRDDHVITMIRLGQLQYGPVRAYLHARLDCEDAAHLAGGEA